MKVLALTRYGRQGASSRIRTLQYLPYLTAAGHEVEVRPLLTDGYLSGRYDGRPTSLGFVLHRYVLRVATALRGARYDVVWLEKELLPWAPGVIERALLAGAPYAVDYDDATFHTYDHHPNPVLRALMARKIDRVMRGAAVVTAGNGYLADRARAAGARRVEILPSVVDLTRYGEAAAPPDGPFTIGWIGSPGSERLLEPLRGVLAETVARPGVRLVLVGASERALKGVPHERWEWSEADEADQVKRFHVGIMPLEDTPWERGKCGFKLIQYMAAARAVVASPVGANASIVDDGVTGFLARTREDWTRAFARLREDRALCMRLGRAGRAKVEKELAIAVTAPRVVEILSSAARGREAEAQRAC